MQHIHVFVRKKLEKKNLWQLNNFEAKGARGDTMMYRVIKEERERKKKKKNFSPASIIGTNIAVEKFDYTMKPRGK